MTKGYRTDLNNNPAAFITTLAIEAGLVRGVDFMDGDPFPAPSKFMTARLLGDPVEITIRVIDKVGYYTQAGMRRWDYIGMPAYVWKSLTHDLKRDVIGFHYRREGGTLMRGLFPNYDKV